MVLIIYQVLTKFLNAINSYLSPFWSNIIIISIFQKYHTKNKNCILYVARNINENGYAAYIHIVMLHC